ncbi:hypothetical protein LCGC14_1199910 [marine sediment metagenome]|uniref:Inositol 1,3,4-trisphosphate 5/6-kinase ATP-grasp domain-containing protein n=1 Tax=marine sediment metagenome TaxID=412755 RepID=A0A0F9M4M9_9ZZZZ|nr:MAG: Inositol 1, 3, 4-trisphosphate 5/6-kinase [Candidatus Lokiarchaeum sp. GC14_75]HEC40770.1 hypothetical protein [bacterium]
MYNKLNKIYIGAICNRDLDTLDEIKKFCNKNYNISIIDLLKRDSNRFNIKYLKKQLKKYPISYIILKILSEDSNKEIYNTISNLAPNIPLVNSLNSVKLCESRQETFKFIEKKIKKLNIPKHFFTMDKAFKACCEGIKIIIKLDKHNFSNLPKNDRIIGIAKNPNQFLELTNPYSERELFFQEYLGKFDTIYKIYVIGRWVVSITSHNRLNQNHNLSPLELIHIRVPIEKQLKRRILRLGRKMGMSIFGIDYILTKDSTPYIVDINDFPSFRRIPEAVSLISDFIYNSLVMRDRLYITPVKAKG